MRLGLALVLVLCLGGVRPGRGAGAGPRGAPGSDGWRTVGERSLVLEGASFAAPLRFHGMLEVPFGVGGGPDFDAISALDAQLDGHGEVRVLALTDGNERHRACRLLRIAPVVTAGRLVALRAEPGSGRILRPPVGSGRGGESLARLASGAWLLSFEEERTPRFARWRQGDAPHWFPDVDALRGRDANAGLEACTPLGGGRVLALAEERWTDARPGSRAWLLRAGDTGVTVEAELVLPWTHDARLGMASEPHAYLEPKGAATLPRSGDVLVLEKKYTRDGSFVALRRIPAAEADDSPLPAGELHWLPRPERLSNFEGITCWPTEDQADGRSYVLLAVDNNGRASLPTFFALFSLPDRTPSGAHPGAPSAPAGDR